MMSGESTEFILDGYLLSADFFAVICYQHQSAGSFVAVCYLFTLHKELRIAGLVGIAALRF